MNSTETHPEIAVIKNDELQKDLPPVIVNHGKVFGENDWFTFYCPHCGISLIKRSDKCDGDFPANGCGGSIKWANKK